ncbi:hypothetical protein F2Q68_00002865 [Brassica cretica]|uniref:Uncharacterized protein n=1 Tax=Brassica cretica TaxID=69181 RepID=A0A8S9J9N0_BRACR|nr:hypothetical protein F2Q68_00002865 [Brassica cretica]
MAPGSGLGFHFRKCSVATSYGSVGGAASSGFTARSRSSGSWSQSDFWVKELGRFSDLDLLWVHCKRGGRTTSHLDGSAEGLHRRDGTGLCSGLCKLCELFDRWPSMAPWWLLCVLLHFATPLRFHLSRKLRAKTTAFLLGVVPLVIIVVLSPSTPEIVFLQRQNMTFRFLKTQEMWRFCSAVIDRHGGFEAYGSESSNESTHFLQVFDADYARICLVRRLPSARRSSMSL